MYVVTFYSFKGGVGRTMAMVNTAADLAARGCRVLLVDFDLEAPGLPTYDAFARANDQPGIVDYIHSYLETGVTPDVRDYLVECKVPNLERGAMFVLSAGRREPAYASRLASIDWQDLYREHEGYLMFEDLKQQLAQIEPKIDYVLIDSRTGHTDVGGICTRQLPDEVVLLFHPNEQNVSGLKTVVEDIRNESSHRKHKIRLLFCPSNVPDLDDEDDILKDRLDQARRDLGFQRPATVIKHYDSLIFLKQPIFVLGRSRTRLAAAYRELSKAIAKGNFEDKVGALAQIEDFTKELRSRRAVHFGDPSAPPTSLAQLRETLEKVQEHHRGDGEVAWALAGAYGALGYLDGEAGVLGIAIEQGYRPSEAKLRRAFTRVSLGLKEEAIEDLTSVLEAEDISAVGFSSAVQLFIQLKKEFGTPWVEDVRRSPALARVSPEDQLAVASLLTSDVDAMDLAAELASAVRKRTSDKTLTDKARTLQQLAFVGAGQFDEAMAAADDDRERVLGSDNVTLVFNYAMAEWGAVRQPPLDMLQAVVTLDKENTDRAESNYHQCLSLVHAVLGNREEALFRLDKAIDALTPGPPIFSCWRYVHTGLREMRTDLDVQREFILSGKGEPDFLRGRARLKQGELFKTS